jgi:hypothetical protein
MPHFFLMLPTREAHVIWYELWSNPIKLVDLIRHGLKKYTRKCVGLFETASSLPVDYRHTPVLPIGDVARLQGRFVRRVRHGFLYPIKGDSVHTLPAIDFSGRFPKTNSLDFSLFRQRRMPVDKTRQTLWGHRFRSRIVIDDRGVGFPGSGSMHSVLNFVKCLENQIREHLVLVG